MPTPPTMNPFITTLLEPVSWEVPTFPLLDDPVWQSTFNTANPAQKINLANGWMWRASQEYETLKTSQIVPWVIEHRKMYALTAPYATQAYMVQSQRGRDIISLVYNDDDTVDDTSDAYKFLRLLETLWLSTKSDARPEIKAAVEQAQVCERGVGYEHRPYLPLLQYLVWDKIAQQNLESDSSAMADGIAISVLAGLFGKNMRDEPSGPEHPVSQAWEGLALYGSNKTVFTKDSTLVKSTKKIVAQTPPHIAAKEMRALLYWAKEDGDCGAPVLGKKTMFNASSKDQPNMYTPLYAWIPALSKFWKVAEGLGLDVDEALAQASVEGFGANTTNTSGLPQGVMPHQP